MRECLQCRILQWLGHLEKMEENLAIVQVENFWLVTIWLKIIEKNMELADHK